MDFEKIKKYKYNIGYTALVGSMLTFFPINSTYAVELEEYNVTTEEEPETNYSLKISDSNVENIKEKFSILSQEIVSPQSSENAEKDLADLANRVMMEANMLHENEEYQKAIAYYEVLSTVELFPDDYLSLVDEFKVKAENKQQLGVAIVDSILEIDQEAVTEKKEMEANSLIMDEIHKTIEDLYEKEDLPEVLSYINQVLSSETLPSSSVESIEEIKKFVEMKIEKEVVRLLQESNHSGNLLDSFGILENGLITYPENELLKFELDEISKTFLEDLNTSEQLDEETKSMLLSIQKSDYVSEGIHQHTEKVIAHYSSHEEENEKEKAGTERRTEIKTMGEIPKETLADFEDDKKETNESTSDLRQRIQTSSVQTFSISSEQTLSMPSIRADDYYTEAISAPYASQAWKAATEGRMLYPNDSRFLDAIAQAAERMLVIGTNNHKAGDYQRALEYYNSILDHPDVPSDIKSETAGFKVQAEAGSELKTADDYYVEATTAPYASQAWGAATEGHKLYPNDKRFIDAIGQAAERMLVIGMSSFDAGDYERAVEYYGAVLSVDEVSSQIRNTAADYKLLAEELSNPKTADEYYNEATTAAYASQAWNAAKVGRKLYPNDSRFLDAIAQSAKRMLVIGANSHRASNYQRALEYYNDILQQSDVPSDIKSETAAFKVQAEAGRELKTADDYYVEATTAPYASQAWGAATEGHKLYPNDKRFIDAIAQAAERMLVIGTNSHRSGNYQRAVGYYSDILKESDIPSNLKNEISIFMSQAVSGKSLKTSDDYYAEATTGVYASQAWDAAVEGRKYFPDDHRFIGAIRQAAGRMLVIGIESHQKGNYQRAVEYYDSILERPEIESSLKNEVKGFKLQAQSNKKLKTPEDYYKEVSTAPYASQAWDVAIEGIQYYPNNSKLVEAMTKASNRLLSVALQAHGRGQFAEAVNFYDQLATQPYVPGEIVNKVGTYKLLAVNNLYIAEFVYATTNYNYSFSEALDRHTNDAQNSFSRNQIQKYNSNSGRYEWVNASREEAERYLNPEHFLSFSVNENDSRMQSVQISTNALNVRKGPSTNYGILTSVSRNQVYPLLESSGGWYKIDINGQAGWVSGDYVSLISQPQTVNVDDVTAIVTASVLNVRSGPGTSNEVLTSVRKGESYSVRNQMNGWIEIEVNGTKGWVSSAYVELSNGLPREMLQFLKLSGSSGIGVTDLNRELEGKGILHDSGKYFSEAASKYNINEIYLLSHALLETGHGTSNLATGIYVDEVDGKPVPGKVVYNMFGIRAYDGSADKSGSEYAYKQGWDTVGKAILGGAEWISRQYINHPTHKQDTLYKMRWNPNNPTVHQYATDIGWAYKQTNSLEMIVQMSEKYDLILRFDIPVYQ